MTGFSRIDGTSEGVNWFWEVRSVNSRGLDVRVRLAPGTEGLEPKVRQAVANSFKRGNVTLSLNMQRRESDIEVFLNEDVLNSVLAAASRVEKLAGCQPARVDSLLGLKGVLEMREKEDDPETVLARHQGLLEGLDKALRGVIAAREQEGRQLEGVISGQFDEIERLTKEIEDASALKIETTKSRLKHQVQKLLDTGQELDPMRLHQEAVMLATRSDVEEELKRLLAHVVAGRDLLKNDGAVGRKLDFLAQELNREANTLCAKSNDSDITQAGLQLKVVIDQMREQVQNIE